MLNPSCTGFFLAIYKFRKGFYSEKTVGLCFKRRLRNHLEPVDGVEELFHMPALGKIEG